MQFLESNQNLQLNDIITLSNSYYDIRYSGQEFTCSWDQQLQLEANFSHIFQVALRAKAKLGALDINLWHLKLA